MRGWSTQDFYINGDYSEIPPRGVAGVTELSLSPFFLKNLKGNKKNLYIIYIS